ncbi:ATP-binding protein [Pseudofrankia sp. BMG5.37]|uniref:sensor histidine kinase n=1 Tax=Pseudofrankia sp. BMG5.37 TaxID=3050035 RepID=UPI002895D4E0|nr:ATP-binding protein [Pseudofrankia sp. BMG5.37]MDT3438886.1 ATP-binding protein [Pseudofrankia sp. BMG5.37]
MTGSARLRILGWQLLLVALALAGSVLAARQVLLARVDERVDQGLAKEVSELRRFVDKSVDPATGRSQVADVRALLEAYLERAIPDRNQTMLALVNGAPAYRSAETPPYRLDADRAAIDAFVSATSAGQPHYGRVATPTGAVRYVAVPVSVQGHPERGVFVSAVFVDRERAEVDEVVRVLGVVGFGALAVAGAAGWMVAGRVLAPVRMVRRTAQAITETDLSRRIPVGGAWVVRRPRRVAVGAGRDAGDSSGGGPGSGGGSGGGGSGGGGPGVGGGRRGGDRAGRDEITELARTFNGMLDRLEQAFATQRAFVDDAGHELRTPITIIRGHLELLGDDPDERAETVALVLDELDRMSRMVDDLLVLAKAEQPDFLRREPVDLAVFTTDLFVKARALAPRAWRLQGVGDGRLFADRQRLTQALLQLAQNATQHTRTGGAIGIGSAVDDHVARFWVTDSGPGVAPADRARIFERFARGAPTRPPAAAGGGAGLGLAIVRAIATAHGGAVRVSGEPGEGATFALELSLLDHGPRDHEPRRPAPRGPEPGGVEPGGVEPGGVEPAGPTPVPLNPAADRDWDGLGLATVRPMARDSPVHWVARTGDGAGERWDGMWA